MLPFDGTCREPYDVCPPSVLVEPSGVCFDRARGVLVAVGDEGDVVELAPDGTVRRRASVGDVDLEGVTIGPGGRIYAVVEGPAPAILVLSPETLEVERRIEVDPTCGGEPAIGLQPNGGLEGICYVPEAGSFFAVNQLGPPRLVELSLPADGARAFVKRIVADLERIECASDLAWDEGSRHFLVTSSSFGRRPGKLWELTDAGAIVRERRLPGQSQEGFCLDAEGNAYVACDTGGILRCEPERPALPAPHEIDRLVLERPLGAAAVRIDEIERSAAASVHLVQVRGEVAPNLHERHEELVILHRGEGRLRLGDREAIAMRAGSFVLVPRGVVHGFKSTGAEPAVALAIFTPPFDGKDRVPVK